jgi:hypothetical protein
MELRLEQPGGLSTKTPCPYQRFIETPSLAQMQSGTQIALPCADLSLTKW